MMERKINLLITVTNVHVGGIASLLLTSTPSLAKKMNVEIAYFGHSGEMLQRFLDAGIKMTYFPYSGKKDMLKVVLKLAKHIKKEKIDVVSTNFFMDKVIVFFASRITKFKIVSTFHSVKKPTTLTPNKYFQIFFHKYVVDKNFAVSKSVLESWVKYRGLSLSNSKVLYSGIENLPCETQKIRCKEKEVIFVTAARITKVKGFERLIHYFSILNKRKSNWQFWIIGDGFQKAYLQELVLKLELQKKIIFIGYQTDLCGFYKKADFFINSSVREALSISILEALSAGVPSVGSNVGGIPEVINHEENGFLVNFNDAEESLFVLQKCLEMEEDRYLALSKKAKETFYHKFWIDRYVQTFNEELEEIV